MRSKMEKKVFNLLFNVSYFLAKDILPMIVVIMAILKEIGDESIIIFSYAEKRRQ